MWRRSSGTARRSSSSPRSTTSTTSPSDSRARIIAAVEASATTLTEIFGVGPIVAAMLIGYSGDPTRFATASRYATYTGTAPIEFSSGGRTIHRLSRRGNRRLNHALHCAAITQIRHRHSPGPRLLRTQARRRQDPARSDPRAQAPAQRRRLAAPRRRRPTRHQRQLTAGPGRTLQDDSVACVTGSHLHTGSSAKSLPGPETQPYDHPPATT